MADPDKPRFVSPYDVRLELDGFENMIKRGVGREKLLFYASKEPDPELKSIISEFLNYTFDLEDY